MLHRMIELRSDKAFLKKERHGDLAIKVAEFGFVSFDSYTGFYVCIFGLSAINFDCIFNRNYIKVLLGVREFLCC